MNHEDRKVIHIPNPHAIRTDVSQLRREWEEGTYLAKQDTSIKESKTTLGLVPARLRTLVIKMRSILVLLRADAIVKPPIRSIIVGENMIENMYLWKEHVQVIICRSLGHTVWPPLGPSVCARHPNSV